MLGITNQNEHYLTRSARICVCVSLWVCVVTLWLLFASHLDREPFYKTPGCAAVSVAALVLLIAYFRLERCVPSPQSGALTTLKRSRLPKETRVKGSCREGLRGVITPTTAVSEERRNSRTTPPLVPTQTSTKRPRFPGRLPGRPPGQPLSTFHFPGKAPGPPPNARLGAAARQRSSFILGRKLHCGEITQIEPDSLFQLISAQRLGIRPQDLRENFGPKKIPTRIPDPVINKLGSSASPREKLSILSSGRATNIGIVLAKLSLSMSALVESLLDPMQFPTFLLDMPIAPSQSCGIREDHWHVSTIFTPRPSATGVDALSPGDQFVRRTGCQWCRRILEDTSDGRIASSTPPPLRRSLSSTECDTPLCARCMTVLGRPSNCFTEVCNDLEKLLSVFPTNEEARLLRDFQGDQSLLRDVEVKLLPIRNVPFAKDKCKAWHVILTLSENVRTIQCGLARIVATMEDVRGSESLRWCFGGVMDLINIINMPMAKQQFGSAAGLPDTSREWLIKGIQTKDALKLNDFRSNKHSGLRLSHLLILLLNQRLHVERQSAANDAVSLASVRGAGNSSVSMTWRPSPQSAVAQERSSKSQVLSEALALLATSNTVESAAASSLPQGPSEPAALSAPFAPTPVYSTSERAPPEGAMTGTGSSRKDNVQTPPCESKWQPRNHDVPAAPLSQEACRLLRKEVLSVTTRVREEIHDLVDVSKFCPKMLWDLTGRLERDLSQILERVRDLELSVREERVIRPDLLTLKQAIDKASECLSELRSLWNRAVSKALDFLRFFCEPSVTSKAAATNFSRVDASVLPFLECAVESLTNVNELIQMLERAWDDILLNCREYDAAFPNAPYLLTEVVRVADRLAITQRSPRRKILRDFQKGARSAGKGVATPAIDFSPSPIQRHRNSCLVDTGTHQARKPHSVVRARKTLPQGSHREHETAMSRFQVSPIALRAASRRQSVRASVSSGCLTRPSLHADVGLTQPPPPPQVPAKIDEEEDLLLDTEAAPTSATSHRGRRRGERKRRDGDRTKSRQGQSQTDGQSSCDCRKILSSSHSRTSTSDTGRAGRAERSSKTHEMSRLATSLDSQSEATGSPGEDQEKRY